MKRFSLTTSTLVLVFGQFSLLSAQLLDPANRDESISNTNINVTVTQNEVGHYVYAYTLESLESNKGDINDFLIDIVCSSLEEGENFDPSIYTDNSSRYSDREVLHAPVAVIAEYGNVAFGSVSVFGSALWGVHLVPTENITVRLVSNYPPVDRNFVLYPDFSRNANLYDYTGIVENTPNIPWIDDFTVTGITKGPGCTFDVEPPEPEYGVFHGSAQQSESEDENLLITYTQPTRNRYEVATDSESIEFIIHYAKNIAPSSFNATINTLNNAEIDTLFNPVPGTVQAVNIPFNNASHIEVNFMANASCESDVEDATLSNNHCNDGVDVQYRDMDKFKISLEK